MPTIPYVKTTHSDGQIWNAADANQLENGVTDVSYAPAVRVTHNTTQSISNNTETTLAFNTERFDQAGNAADTQHDTVTNNSRLTCKYAGVYLIAANVAWANNPGTGEMFIRLNGTTHIAASQFASADHRIMDVETVYALAVNDYVEVRVKQQSGGALNVSSTGNYSPEFMMCRVA